MSAVPRAPFQPAASSARKAFDRRRIVGPLEIEPAALHQPPLQPRPFLPPPGGDRALEIRPSAAGESGAPPGTGEVEPKPPPCRKRAQRLGKRAVDVDIGDAEPNGARPLARQPAGYRLHCRSRRLAVQKEGGVRRLLDAPDIDNAERDDGRPQHRDCIKSRPVGAVPDAEHNELPPREMAQSRDQESPFGERVRLQRTARKVVPAWPEALDLRGRTDVDRCHAAGRRRVHRANLPDEGLNLRLRYVRIHRSRPTRFVDRDEGEGAVGHLLAMMGAKALRPGFDMDFDRRASDLVDRRIDA